MARGERAGNPNKDRLGDADHSADRIRQTFPSIDITSSQTEY
jgi:hypothetical protein